MIKCVVHGNFNKTKNFLKKASKIDFDGLLEQYAEQGVEALASATPKRSGKTAASWGYEIERSPGSISIYWTNSNTNQNVSVAVILDSGHGTGWGGYVTGKHYISPAIQPVFDNILEAIQREVSSS